MILPMTTLSLTGGCLCGRIRYRAEGEPVNIRACHCRNCQKVTGSAFFPRVMFRREAVSVTGETHAYGSSEDVLRHFCPDCGSTLFSQRVSAGVMSVSFGTLDDPDAVAPTEHIWTRSAQAWLKLDDGLPCFVELPPA